MESFAFDFSQFCSTIVKICLLGGLLGYLPSIPNISGISLKFANFFGSKVVGHLANQEVCYIG